MKKWGLEKGHWNRKVKQRWPVPFLFNLKIREYEQEMVARSEKKKDKESQ